MHFVQLIPYAGELFGTHGVPGDPALNPTHGLFPNPLNPALGDGALQAWLAVSAGLSLLFAAGIARHAAALLLWLSWTALFHRNNLIVNPSMAYIGLLLILSLLVPGGEPWSVGKTNNRWQMPKWVFRSAWILLAAGYTFSGFTKLASPSWVDGSAMYHLLENPLARPGALRDLMLGLPAIFLSLLTWTTLAAELFFLPLAAWWRTRPWIWLVLTVMHLGIMAVVDFADLSLGMLMVHLFTFDPAWLPPLRRIASRLRRRHPSPTPFPS